MVCTCLYNPCLVKIRMDMDHYRNFTATIKGISTRNMQILQLTNSLSFAQPNESTIQLIQSSLRAGHLTKFHHADVLYILIIHGRFILWHEMIFLCSTTDGWMQPEFLTAPPNAWRIIQPFTTRDAPWKAHFAPHAKCRGSYRCP